jgi:hypothetical protein
MNSKLLRKLAFLALLIVFVFQIQPAFLFKPNGKPREYGFGMDSEGYKKTVLNLHFFILCSSVVVTKYI